MKNFILIISAIVLGMVTSAVFAGGKHAHEHSHGHKGNGSTAGVPGEPKNVSRTIVLKMTFKHFEPSKIDVEQGETIKFVLKNISKKNMKL